MHSGSHQNWKYALNETARHSKTKAKIVGLARVEYAQHAMLIQTALLAFGDDPNATFYVDGLPAEGDLPRPDLMILHPEIGVLVIENKGVSLESIHDVENGLFRITRNGILREEDPIHQAERVMFALQDLCKTRFHLDEALFLRTAAFPRIDRLELEQRFNQKMLPEMLFSDVCGDPKGFRSQVLAYSNKVLVKAQKGRKITRHAHDSIMTILSGKALFHPARRTLIAENDPKRLGVQIQQLELATRDATREQKDLGRADLRGAHRLFRGVAGSGKSIMLALSVAQTLILNREDGNTLFENNRDKRVLVVCYNRSLVQHLRGKIEERFCRVAWAKPNETELVVQHFEGLARDLAKNTALATGLDFEQKDQRARMLCAQIDALSQVELDAISFEAIYIDEAQDLLPTEFEVLRRLVRPDEDGGQTLILFYDNAQNIYGVTPPTWEKLGINIVGRTVFLDTFLRNTREVLKFAFNVLVGSFAFEGQRVATRQFADMADLRQRGLIEEHNGVFDVLFSSRNGPAPTVNQFMSRKDEVTWMMDELRRLFSHESVLPSDILLLYKSDYLYKDMLPSQLETILPKGFRLRQVDRMHRDNKNLPLLEDGYLTLSTIASAKGYDAPVVFLLGVDELAADPQGRASFYVGATRAKLLLYVSGLGRESTGLMAEAVEAAKHSQSRIAHAEKSKVSSRIDEPSHFQNIPLQRKRVATQTHKCQHCGSTKLHCQQGGHGYYFVCIDCTKMTPLSRKCSKCGETARVRARGRGFVRICKSCNTSEIVHTNARLEFLEE